MDILAAFVKPWYVSDNMKNTKNMMNISVRGTGEVGDERQHQTREISRILNKHSIPAFSTAHSRPSKVHDTSSLRLRQSLAAFVVPSCSFVDRSRGLV